MSMPILWSHWLLMRLLMHSHIPSVTWQRTCHVMGAYLSHTETAKRTSGTTCYRATRSRMTSHIPSVTWQRTCHVMGAYLSHTETAKRTSGTTCYRALKSRMTSHIPSVTWQKRLVKAIKPISLNICIQLVLLQSWSMWYLPVIKHHYAAIRGRQVLDLDLIWIYIACSLPF